MANLSFSKFFEPLKSFESEQDGQLRQTIQTYQRFQ